MANQYSITLSDESARVLKHLKERNYKVSRVIDVALKTLGPDALMRLDTNERILKRHHEESE